MVNKKKLILALALIFFVNILLICVFQTASAATYKRGSSGSVVSQIQTVLKQWGYFGYDIDGVYGSRTEAAVRAFQQRSGLRADGNCGPATLEAMGIDATGAGMNGANDLTLLARLISAEANGEPYNGQVAVGAVALNRLKHPSFPDTLSGVIYQNGAFSSIADGRYNNPATDSAMSAARDALNGADPSGGAIYYFDPSTVTDKWLESRPLLVIIGRHSFCA